MTLGGIAAAIGLVIDDAIVVVEAIYAKIAHGLDRMEAIQAAIGEIFAPLVGSTLTPVVVFIPLAFLEGITGVFFRALALTMVVALLTSLVLAVTLTPSLAGWFIRDRAQAGTWPRTWKRGRWIPPGPRFPDLRNRHEWRIEAQLADACRLRVVLVLGIGIYQKLESEFLPAMDEGGFVIDYVAPPGTSLTETHRQLLFAEQILNSNEDVESFSRRTGARLALSIAEPNTGDFLVKLKHDRKHKTQEVIAELRSEVQCHPAGY